MKELFKTFKRIPLDKARNLILIDTCFFISVFEHPEHIEQFVALKNKSMTSFNVLELIRVEHNLHHLKHRIRKFLENSQSDNLRIIDIDIVPGQKKKEKEFVASISPGILDHCKDPSDAVLLAVAIKTGSDILTKDKHHLFNAVMENFVHNNITIYKELKELL
jgi:predicted nucleic acid-binding protein